MYNMQMMEQLAISPGLQILINIYYKFLKGTHHFVLYKVDLAFNIIFILYVYIYIFYFTINNK